MEIKVDVLTPGNVLKFTNRSAAYEETQSYQVSLLIYQEDYTEAGRQVHSVEIHSLAAIVELRDKLTQYLVELGDRDIKVRASENVKDNTRPDLLGF